jgi:hypothetical protein
MPVSHFFVGPCVSIWSYCGRRVCLIVFQVFLPHPMPVNKPDPTRDSLSEGEIWWRDHQVWLDERGYKLRPRLTPGWVPSWLGKDVRPRISCEDFQYEHGNMSFILHHLSSHFCAASQVQDAVRKDNNQRVMMKKVNTKRIPKRTRNRNLLLFKRTCGYT